MEDSSEIQEILNEVLEVSPEEPLEVADEETFEKLRQEQSGEITPFVDEEERKRNKEYEWNNKVNGGLRVEDIISLTPEKLKDQEEKSVELTIQMRELAKNKIKLFHRLESMKSKDLPDTKKKGLKNNFEEDVEAINNADFYEAKYVFKFLQNKEKELKRKLLMQRNNKESQEASQQLLKDINEFNEKAEGADFSSPTTKVYNPDEIARYEEELRKREEKEKEEQLQ